MSGRSIAAIIPVRDAGATIEETLRSIYASSTPPDEVIVVDDGCSDRSMEIARRFPARILPSEPPGGVARARNTGAAAARGEILLFVDADVVLEPNAVRAAADALADPGVSVAVGLQSAVSPFPNAASVYKNYWLHYTYKKRAERLAVLYSSAVAIRREPFEQAGGFDPNYRTPNIEDSDLGKRLTDAGCRIAVVPEMEFRHIKRYDLSGMFRTDFRRTVGMTKVQIRDRFRRILKGNYSSIPTSFLVSCLAPWIAPPLLAAGEIFAALLFPPALVLLLNRDWIRSLAESQGARAGLLGAFFLHLDVVAVNLGVLWGIAEYAAGKKY
ncbi:MAG: glycosyltransferase family 2 protein [Candidatus Eisenbacteria bacterium]|nr:glycosyltransferase family 2 protein [Candidatus Eisenbacteria bacterium]